MRREEQIKDQFLAIPMRPKTMFVYSARTSILERIKYEAKTFKGTVLDIGCGIMPYRGLIESNPAVEKYIGMDLEQPTYYAHVEPDLKWDGHTIPLEDASVDCVMATEVLEHCPEPDRVLTEIFRVTKTGGRFFATVPFVWNLHEVPYDEYRFTPYSIERHLRNAGFRDIRVEALGGWNVSLAQLLALWVEFSKRGFARSVLRMLVFPFYALLVKTDRQPATFDGMENSMFSGLSVTARK
jgi:SAM-dependent methyltransferase